MQKHPRQIRIRHLAPGAFVIALCGSVLLAPVSVVGRGGLVSLVGTYAIANLTAAAFAARSRRGLALYLPPTYAILHFAYGSGFLAGLVRFRKLWGTASAPPAYSSDSRHS
jgi:succinoglycan biosynthesis protein ExoA